MDGTDHGVVDFMLFFLATRMSGGDVTPINFAMPEYHQVIEERPRFVLFVLLCSFFLALIENVSGHQSRGTGICIRKIARMANRIKYNNWVDEDGRFATSLIVFG